MIRLCEMYPAPQGEGPTTGIPSLFVRLSGCNLHCSWCDSFFTWNFKGTKFSNEADIKYPKVNREDESKSYTVEDFAALIEAEATKANVRNLVLTGGEPMMQQKELAQAIRLLGGKYKIEIETNGTLFIEDDMFSQIDQINSSPKLQSSGNELILRYRLNALQRIVSHPKSVFKFVVMTPDDIPEIHKIVQESGMPKDRVFLMPEGVTRAIQIASFDEATRLATENGYNVCPRVHILLNDSKRAV